MPYATNAGIRIHYEVEGAGAPLILHHGSFASGADWRDLGYTEELKRQNRLVLIVLDDLQVERANFFGYSMGDGSGLG